MKLKTKSRPRDIPQFHRKLQDRINPQFSISLGASEKAGKWEKEDLTWKELKRRLAESPKGAKDGACYTPAIFSGKRNKENAQEIRLLVHDVDCGYTKEQVIAAVKKAGWKSFMHTTWSHLTWETEISIKAFDDWKTKTGKTDKAIGSYLHTEKGYLPEIVKNASINTRKTKFDEEGKEVYVAHHRPCPKFRVITLLNQPWRASDFASPDKANTWWENAYLATIKVLGLACNESCKTSERIFLFPRTRPPVPKKPGQPEKLSPTYFFQELKGKPCNLQEIVTQAPSQEQSYDPDYFDFTDGKWEILPLWIKECAKDFELAQALRERAPNIVGKPAIKQTIICPFGPHSAKSTATIVVNASEISQAHLPKHTSGFYVKCRVTRCTDKTDRMVFLTEMLNKEWLSPADLLNPHFYPDDWELPIKEYTGKMDLINLATVKPEKMSYLMDGWLARGMVHILAGKKGDAKSTITLDLAATVSTGGTFPGGSQAPRAGTVILYNGEDHLERVIVPRLEQAGADLNKIEFCGPIRKKDNEVIPFNPAEHMPKLIEAIEGINDVDLIIIDQVIVISGSKWDSHKDAEVRQALAPLIHLAKARDIVVLGVIHLTKGSQGQDPIERVMASTAWTAVAYRLRPAPARGPNTSHHR